MIHPVSMSNYSIQNKNSNGRKVSFSGKLDIATIDNILSQRSCKLVKRAGQMIDDAWPKFKKRAPMSIPEFTIKKNDTRVTLKPLYNFERESLYLEVNDDRYIERVIVERVNPNNFRYEKAVKTDNGSATLKTYNSQNGYSYEMASRVSDLVERYFPNFLPVIPEKKYSWLK